MSKVNRPNMWTVVFDSKKYQIIQRKTRLILIQKEPRTHIEMANITLRRMAYKVIP